MLIYIHWFIYMLFISISIQWIGLECLGENLNRKPSIFPVNVWGFPWFSCFYVPQKNQSTGSWWVETCWDPPGTFGTFGSPSWGKANHMRHHEWTMNGPVAQQLDTTYPYISPNAGCINICLSRNKGIPIYIPEYFWGVSISSAFQLTAFRAADRWVSSGLMPKRKAARNDRAIDIQPSLLHSLPRPTDPEQLSIWTANVRARLTVLQAGICKLESEKQVLLSLLSDASNDFREVLTDAPSSEICPRGEVPGESSNSLWNAAQGFPSDVLANNINASSVHPALKYDENDAKSLPGPTLSKSDTGQIGDHLECRSAEFNRERIEEEAAPTAATFPSVPKARHSDAHSGLIASIEALSHTGHTPHAPGQLDGSMAQPAPAQPAPPAQAAQPRSPSMASTILLSSEDEGQQVPGDPGVPGVPGLAPNAPTSRHGNGRIISIHFIHSPTFCDIHPDPQVF